MVVPFDPAVGMAAKVELALGANPDADPSTWTWTDVSAYALGPQVTIRKGRSDWAGSAQPLEITLQLRNNDDRFTPGNPFSPYYPYITRNLPVRVSVPVGTSPPTERATGFIRSLQTGWVRSPKEPVVSVTAKGRLARLQRQRAVLRSPLFRSISGTARGATAVRPRVYWPCEDGGSATSAASAIAGIAPMNAAAVSFGAESTLVSSDPLPTMSSSGSGAAITGQVPFYTGPSPNQWCAVWVMKMPSSPAVTTYPVAVVTDGTAALWSVAITPGAPDNVGIRAYNSSFTQILSNDIAVPTGFYGLWWLFSLGVKQNGANVDYILQVMSTTSTTTVSGSLASRTCGNAMSIRAAANDWTAGSGIGHFAIFTDPAFDNTNDPQWIADVLDGRVGEEPRIRFGRLCTEEGVNRGYDSASLGGGAPETVIGMGPQGVRALADLLGECQDVDMGLIHDGGPSGQLYFNTRTARYNQIPALVMDNHLQEVTFDIVPTFDDQAIVNDFTASRSGGSMGRYIDQANDDAEGGYSDGFTFNVADDSHLYEMAGWRVNQGITPGMRYPQLVLDLMAAPELAQQWLACSIGSRVQATNLPGQYGTADVIIEGYTETIGRRTWRVVLNCSPARPYNIFTLDGTGNTGRLDTAGSSLASAASAGATSLSVATSTGPLWVTGAVSFDVDIAGIQVSVTNISGSTSPQTFTVTGATVTKVLPNGSTVKLWRPSVLAM